MNERIETRQAHLNEVNIDAHNFNLTPGKDSNTAKIESANSQNPNISDEHIVQERTEQETTPEKFVEKDKPDEAVLTSDIEDTVNKENSFPGDGALNPLEESNNISQEEADVAAYSSGKKSPEQNSVPVETAAAEGDKPAAEGNKKDGDDKKPADKKPAEKKPAEEKK